jgi:hypothetical protein|tara:strand:+ start:399 stop:839 length:441 start_codon:yes stop_codon:yes gene_type:complete
MARDPFKKMMSNVNMSSQNQGSTRGNLNSKLKRELAVSKEGRIYRYKKQLEVGITRDDLEKQFKKQKGCDYWMPHYQIDLNEIFVPHSIKAPSVDRWPDPKGGYVKGNFVITTRFMNLGRSNYPEDKFQEFLKEMFGEPTKIEKYF